MTSELDGLVGSQKPRLASVPPCSSTAGPDAVEYSASVGLVMDPWQALVLEGALGEVGKAWAAFEVGVVVTRQNGKGDQSLESEILTTDGWTTFAEIRPGQEVYGADGEPVKVLAVSEIYTDSDCYEVEFTDGARHVVGGDHLWTVSNKNWSNPEPRPVSTKDIATRTGGIRADNGRNEFNYRVRCDAIVGTPEVDLPIDPYLLGYWLGDGTTGRASITVGHEDEDWTAHRITSAGAHIGRRSTHSHGHARGLHFNIGGAAVRDGFESRCRRLGVWNAKRIPEEYLTGSVGQRRSLLAGLMDSDGSIRRNTKSAQVEFTTCLPGLAEDFLRLVRSLGIRAVQHVGPTTHRDRYRFLWTPSFDPFEMPRKSQRFFPPDRTMDTMSIVAVRPVPTVPTRCIQVDRWDGTYLTGRLFTPTHNSILEARELAGVELFGERLIIHTAHELKTAEEARLRMETICESSPDLDRQVKRVVRTNGKEAIEFRNGARIKYLARSKGSGRGFSGDLIVMDEAMFLSSESMAALLPTLLTAENPQVWYTGSAGLSDSTQLQMVRDRGIRGDDPSLAYFEWSMPDGADLDDPKEWAKANPGLNLPGRVSADRLANLRAALTDDDFATEHGGIWPGGKQHAVIPAVDWADLADVSSQPLDPVAFALDVTPDRSSSSIAVAGHRTDGSIHVEVVANDPGTGWVTEAIVHLAQTTDLPVVVDASGPGASLIPTLEDEGVTVKTTSTREMGQACGMFYDAAIDSRTLRHIDQPPLNIAIGVARKRKLGDLWAWHRSDPNVDISPLVAATLAVFGLSQAPKKTKKSGRIRGL